LDQILDATFAIWHEGLTRDAYGRWWAGQLRTPWGRTHLERFALVHDGEVLASAKEYRLSAILDGELMEVAGSSGRGAPPPQRGRGCARELIERLVGRAARRGARAALLFSEIGAGYYGALGFDTVPTSTSVLRVADPPRRGAPAVLVRAG